MGVVQELEPKGLIEYEERALFVITTYSLFLVDVPAARRVAHKLGDEELERLLALVTPPLTALGRAQELVEERALWLSRQIIQYERVKLLVQNLEQKWDISFDATHRASTIYIRNIQMKERSWMTRLFNEPPTVTIVRQPSNL